MLAMYYLICDQKIQKHFLCSGVLSTYHTFWDSFESSVHNNPSLKDVPEVIARGRCGKNE
jgi:hypothetical protein